MSTSLEELIRAVATGNRLDSLTVTATARREYQCSLRISGQQGFTVAIHDDPATAVRNACVALLFRESEGPLANPEADVADIFA